MAQGTETNSSLDGGSLEAARDRVLAFTREMFGNATQLDKQDAEATHERYLLITANTAGQPDEIAGRYEDWYQHLELVASDHFDHFRLALRVSA